MWVPLPFKWTTVFEYVLPFIPSSQETKVSIQRETLDYSKCHVEIYHGKQFPFDSLLHFRTDCAKPCTTRFYSSGSKQKVLTDWSDQLPMGWISVGYQSRILDYWDCWCNHPGVLNKFSNDPEENFSNTYTHTHTQSLKTPLLAKSKFASKKAEFGKLHTFRKKGHVYTLYSAICSILSNSIRLALGK